MEPLDILKTNKIIQNLNMQFCSKFNILLLYQKKKYFASSKEKKKKKRTFLGVVRMEPLCENQNIFDLTLTKFFEF